MSEETRQTLKTVLVAVVCVVVLTALAWWSVVGMVFVTLAALVGLGVGWHLGSRQALKQIEQARPRPRQRTPARLEGGTKR